MMTQQPRFEAKFYYNLSLDRLVPDDHLLRQIDRAVDFAFIRPLCRRSAFARSPRDVELKGLSGKHRLFIVTRADPAHGQRTSPPSCLVV